MAKLAAFCFAAYLAFIFECSFAIAQAPPRTPSPALKELTIVFGVYRPPYIFEKRNVGLDYDLAEAILKNSGYSMKAIHSPNNRALKEIELGKVDGVIGVALKPDRENLYHSDPIISYDNVVITKKSTGVSIEKAEDLKKVRFLAFSNARNYLGPEYLKIAKEVRYDTEISNQEDQNRMFWQDKVQAIILDINIFRFYRNSLKDKFNTSEEIVVHRIFSAKSNERVAVFKSKLVRDKFNEALRELRSSGAYQKIFDRYSTIEPVKTPESSKPQKFSLLGAGSLFQKESGWCD
jgi:polar amino acid transport system substrate-binding protein